MFPFLSDLWWLSVALGTRLRWQVALCRGIRVVVPWVTWQGQWLREDALLVSCAC